HSRERDLDREDPAVDALRTRLAAPRLTLPAVELPGRMHAVRDDRLRARAPQLDDHRAVRHLVLPSAREVVRRLRDEPLVRPRPSRAPRLHRRRRDEDVPQPEREGAVEVHVHEAAARRPEEESDVPGPRLARRVEVLPHLRLALLLPALVLPAAAVRPLAPSLDRDGAIPLGYGLHGRLRAILLSPFHDQRSPSSVY